LPRSQNLRCAAGFAQDDETLLLESSPSDFAATKIETEQRANAPTLNQRRRSSPGVVTKLTNVLRQAASQFLNPQLCQLAVAEERWLVVEDMAHQRAEVGLSSSRRTNGPEHPFIVGAQDVHDVPL